jgi:phosphohistidine swiveling domain-containing protein
MLSHGAVVARECVAAQSPAACDLAALTPSRYSLPCVVGVTGACDMLRTGMIVELDGDAGIVTVLQAAPAACSPNVRASLSLRSRADRVPRQLSAAAGPARAVDLKGTPVSSGVARGRARVARTLEEAEAMVEGEILITPQTDVGWTPYFSMAAGLCTEIGGMLSHGAVVAREWVARRLPRLAPQRSRRLGTRCRASWAWAALATSSRRGCAWSSTGTRAWSGPWRTMNSKRGDASGGWLVFKRVEII